MQTLRHKFGIALAALTPMQKKKVLVGRLLWVGGLCLTLVVCVAAQATESVLARARKYEPHFIQAGQRFGVDPRLLWIVAYLESRFQPSAISPKGARGLMQFMPATANRYGLNDPHNAEAAIDAAARYLRDLLTRYGRRVDLALAAYNAGETAVDAALAKASSNGIPPYRETQNYVRRGLLMWQGQAAVNAQTATSAIEKEAVGNKDEVISDDDAPLVLPRGRARQSVYINTHTDAAPLQPQPIKRQSHYFGTRIDNVSAVPLKPPNENRTGKANERQDD